MKIYPLIMGALLLLPTQLFAGQGQQGPQNSAPKIELPSFITLNSHVVVDNNVIVLGDIFQGTGSNSERVVAYAPRPGGRASFDSRWLQRVASAYRLKWRASSRMDRVVVERASRLVTRKGVEDLLHTYMLNQGEDTRTRAVLSNQGLRLHLPIITRQDLRVEQMNVEQSNGRFSATVSWGTGANERRRLTGRIQTMTEVPVLADRAMRGDLITKSDITWISVAQSKLSRNVITDLDMIVGMAAKRGISAGRAISMNDVRRPLLVNRGQTVTMLLSTPSMQLSTKGRALQAGSNGDTIRISNLQTSTVIDAVVTGSGRVRVITGVNLAMR